MVHASTGAEIPDERDVDLVIIGSGGAGLCAALTAHERGAKRILVAESEGVVGGSSRLSGGLVMGAGAASCRDLDECAINKDICR